MFCVSTMACDPPSDPSVKAQLLGGTVQELFDIIDFNHKYKKYAQNRWDFYNNKEHYNMDDTKTYPDKDEYTVITTSQSIDIEHFVI